ncbi:WD40 repeat-like protein [Aureobasidium melanogenum CBS 110374]|uniref:WD40 repeat-like protein n=1 Tax=Aureobasidium melanogenum (strain CBS 110374) TaxID=1043003 RepID=A0A074VQF2_AURM1|nr:WD40 repeat-like protein [Aureobasidium melanogenum CBS 110374]KEQ62688.1 WD40 repeat-like protein [Aureobasidium melanogenum CBS 110374]
MAQEEMKVDEGYSGGSEETRSLSDSDSTMHIDPVDGHVSKSSTPSPESMLSGVLSLPPAQRSAFITSLLRLLPDSERYDTAYAALRSLRTSSIASIVERLNPLLHLDPVVFLPPEITSQIFLHLSPSDLLRCSTASRLWRERVLDSTLWRTFFVREGWMPDLAEVRSGEAAEARRRLSLSRNTTQKPPRRKPDGELERSGSIKRAKESVDGWNEQHSTLEADDDAVLQESEDGAASLSAMSLASEADYLDIAPGADPSSGSLPQLSSSLYGTYNASPRVNWLYLYKQRRRLEDNWNKGRYTTFQLPHPDHPEEAHDECVYTIQHSRDWLVSGSRDKTIAIWDLETQRRVRTLSGAHIASVLCLQFDERPEQDIVVSGGSDSFVVIWQFSTGRMIRKMDDAHTESVLNLRFDDDLLITCSKDKTIKIWNRREVFADSDIIPAVAKRQLEIGHPMNPIKEYSLLLTLLGHGAAVNAIQMHQGQIVSASGDRTIKAWDINTGTCTRTFTGHTKGIACVQYDGRRIVSGSSDNTVRIFDAATSAEVACLPGHSNLVRTVQARFGDMSVSSEQLEADARAVDERFHDARMNGLNPDQNRVRGQRNAGSSNPNEVCAVGAKIPPGGGGNAWSRIVSGSYDETVIIWKKDSDGKWVPSRRLRQDEILQTAPQQVTPQPPQNSPDAQDTAAQSAMFAASASVTAPAVWPASASAPQMQQQVQQQTQNHAGPAGPPANHHHHHGHHNRHRVREDSNRVFKLQFDSRRIVCCSQNRVIVGWDFAAGDADLEQASRFFGETD